LVVGVDDVQWLDGSSARALSFAFRRLTGYPVAILATRRLEPGSLDALDLTRAITIKTPFVFTSVLSNGKRLPASFGSS
jgi:hypothetical protein